MDDQGQKVEVMVRTERVGLSLKGICSSPVSAAYGPHVVDPGKRLGCSQ